MDKWHFKSLFRVCFAVLLAATLAMGAPGADDSRHYEVSVRLDVPLVLGVSLMATLGVLRYYGMEKGSVDDLKPKSELLPWDRPLAGRYSGWATTVSHYSGALAVAPLALAGYSLYRGDVDAHDFGAFSLMFVEAFALQSALNQIVRSTQLWPRPFMYSKSGEGREKAESARAEAYGSFYSGAFFGGIYGCHFYRQVVL